MTIVDKGIDPSTGLDRKLCIPTETINYDTSVVFVYYERLYNGSLLCVQNKNRLYRLTGSDYTAYISMTVQQRDQKKVDILTDLP